MTSPKTPTSSGPFVDRRAGEADEGGVRQRLPQVFGEADLLAHAAVRDHEALLEAVLRAVRFVGDHDDVAAGGQQRMFAIVTSEFLDGGEYKSADVDREQAAHVVGAVGLRGGAA